jgi:hypothetical protein
MSPDSTQNFFSDWGMLKHGGTQGTILGVVVFIIYINGLLIKINSLSEPLLFADDPSVIISSRNFEGFCSVSN